MTLLYEKFVLGDLATNCYLVWEEGTKDGVIIDPADSGVELAEETERRQIKLTGIWATHGHFDHLLGALDLKLIYKIPFYCHGADRYLLKKQRGTARYFLKREISVPNFSEIDVDLGKLKKIKVGKEVIKVIPCPGHTPGSVAFYAKTAGLLFSGDTNVSQTKPLSRLPKDTLVCPGHEEEFGLGRVL